MAAGARVLVLLLALLARNLEAALPPLPDKLNVESTVIIVDSRRDITKMFQVKEFISHTEGSIKLTVLDVTESERGKNKQDYFRLLEHEPLDKRGELDNRLITYDHKENRCMQEHTNIWQLADFTRLLNDLYDQTSESNLRTDLIAHDRTSIGPEALLQIVYENAEKFTYETKSFDFLHLTDAFYFALRFPLKFADSNQERSSKNRREAKLVVVVARQHVNTDEHDGYLFDRIKLGKTRLSELSSLGHITAIGLVVDDSSPNGEDGDEAESLLALRSPELLDFGTNTLPKSAAGLIVSYSLIQERSLVHNLGAADSIFDLFLLPSGIGCGYVSAHRPTYLSARQFSGKFETTDHSDEHFVAFDESSQHFRFDSAQGKYIYSLKDKTVTLIRPEVDSSRVKSAKENENELASKEQHPYNRFLSQQEQVASSNTVHEYQTHCAQTSLMDEHELLGMKAMSDVLGAGGDRTGLMYLGSRRLEPSDELSLRVHIYEREIFHSQIPLLLRLNLRIKPRVAMTKYTLVFYFVDEAPPHSSNEAETPNFEATWVGVLEDTMWLKRLELVSSNSIQKYQFLNARITFSRFSWSLESIAEETRDRHSKLMHPSRTFDMLECWPARAHKQLDALLELTPSPPSEAMATGGSGVGGGSPVQQVESLEETLFQFLVQQIEFPRSFVSDFELVDEASSTLVAEDDSKHRVLMRAKITMPFNHYYNSMYLVGWVRSLPALLHANQAELVVEKFMMPHHECALVLATKWATLRLPSSFYMLRCPLLGCAMLKATKLDEKALADFVPEREHPSPAISTDNYSDMCEVHMIRRSYSGTELVSERFRSDKIAPKLQRAKLELNSSYFGAPMGPATGSASTKWNGQVKEVMLDTGVEADMRDEQLLSGLCYGLSTKLTRKVYGNQTEELHQRFVVLDLDKHHSRIHCHKACMLYQFCNTYSYSTARRECTLSDVTPEQIHDPSVRMDQNRPYDCTIHALNQLGLFTRRSFIVFSRPMDLVARQNAVLGLSIENCARFCHHNELIFEANNSSGVRRAVIGCQSFDYMRLRSLCILEPATKLALDESLERDKQLVNRLESTGDLENYFGDHQKDKVSETEAYECYKRDYTQHYSVQHNYGLELRQPAGVLQAQSAVSKVENLDLVECARECTIIKRTCVTFDHCRASVNGRYTNLCYLYDIRAPLTIPGNNLMSTTTTKVDSAKLEAKLGRLEAYFYIANRSSEHWVSLERKDHCAHYYLDGDQLYLKGRLNVATRSSHADDKPLIESLEQKLTSRSSGQQQQQQDATIESETSAATKLKPTGNHERTGGTDSFGQLCVQMLAGILLGAFVFIVQPKIGRAISNLGLGEMFENLWNTTRRKERSMSRVEITEMVDMQ